MLKLIASVIQLLVMIFKSKMENDEANKKKKAEQENEAMEALKSGDVSRINASIGKLRQ